MKQDSTVLVYRDEPMLVHDTDTQPEWVAVVFYNGAQFTATAPTPEEAKEKALRLKEESC